MYFEKDIYVAALRCLVEMQFLDQYLSLTRNRRTSVQGKIGLCPETSRPSNVQLQFDVVIIQCGRQMGITVSRLRFSFEGTSWVVVTDRTMWLGLFGHLRNGMLQ